MEASDREYFFFNTGRLKFPVIGAQRWSCSGLLIRMMDLVFEFFLARSAQSGVVSCHGRDGESKIKWTLLRIGNIHRWFLGSWKGQNRTKYHTIFIAPKSTLQQVSRQLFLPFTVILSIHSKFQGSRDRLINTLPASVIQQRFSFQGFLSYTSNTSG